MDITTATRTGQLAVDADPDFQYVSRRVESRPLPSHVTQPGWLPGPQDAQMNRPSGDRALRSLSADRGPAPTADDAWKFASSRETAPLADHDLTIIVPAYNEERRLPATLDGLQSYLDSWGLDYRVLVIDDGSQDGTARLTEGR